MKLTTHYMTYTDFPRLGIGTSDPLDFDGAVDLFAENMEDGDESIVFRVEPSAKGKAGMMIDVTEDALACVAKRLRIRNQDMPQWLVEALQ